MIAAFIIVGIFVGTISGFFGVGGGMILVPALMAAGVDIKSAIGVSIVQMVFSSYYGSHMNYRKGLLQLNEGIWVGIGGIFGGVIGARFTDLLPPEILSYIFLALVIFALLRILRSKPLSAGEEEGSFSPMVLSVIGLGIGVIAMMLGVGGSVMLTPILVGFLHFPTKKASTAGLFFVVFSSTAGLAYKLMTGTFHAVSLQTSEILSIAFAAIVGVILGIKLKDLVSDSHHRQSMIVLYVVILGLMLKKIFM